jgi:hypothetical protein
VFMPSGVVVCNVVILTDVACNVFMLKGVVYYVFMQ